MHLLDTDTLSHLHAGNARVIERLRKLDDADVATTVITKIELLRGRFEYVMKAANGDELLRAQDWLTKTEVLLSQIRIVGLDERSAETFDQLGNTSRLRKIGRADQLIASIALAHQAVLVTRNLRHFDQISQLKLANWVD